MRKIAILSILIGLAYSATTQIVVKGRLLNDDTGEPIQFSNVFLQNQQSIGTASNEQGFFTLILPEEAITSDIIVFSSISHGVSRFAISVFNDSIGYTDIFITPLAYQIQAVQIIAPSDRAKQIVWEAIRNRRRTFNRRSHVLHAFFRETTIHLYDSVYSSLAEADISILDYGIKATNESTRILINELRRSDDFRHDIYTNPHMKRLTASFNRSNGIINAYQHVFKPCSEDKCFTSRDFLDRNDFFFMKEIYDCNDTIDVIGFLPKSIKEIENRKFSAVYNLYINRSDKGILKYEMRWDFDHGFFNYFIQTFEKNNDGLYYPRLIIWDYSYASKTIYVYDVSRSYSDRIRVSWAKTEKPTEDIFDKEYTYNPDFWDYYSTMELIPAPEKMQSDLERDRKLLEQFGNPK